MKALDLRPRVLWFDSSSARLGQALNPYCIRLPSNNGYLVYRFKFGGTVAAAFLTRLTVGEDNSDEYCKNIVKQVPSLCNSLDIEKNSPILINNIILSYHKTLL